MDTAVMLTSCQPERTEPGTPRSRGMGGTAASTAAGRAVPDGRRHRWWPSRSPRPRAGPGDRRAGQARAGGRHRRRPAGSRAGAHPPRRRAGRRAPRRDDHGRHPGTPSPGAQAGLVLAERPVAPGPGRAAARVAAHGVRRAAGRFRGRLPGAALGSYDGYLTLQMAPVWVLLPAGLLAGSAALAVAGVRAVACWLPLPAEMSFVGQVIARWVEEGSDGGENGSTVTYWCLALDDGQRAWTFDVGQAAFGQFPLGARIRARIAPRSMRLPDLAMAGPEGDFLAGQPRWGEAAGTGPGPCQTRPRAGLAATADDPSAPNPVLLGPLVTAADVEAVLGFGIRFVGTPTPFATAYQGSGVTVSLITTSGRVAGMNARAARRSGRPLPFVVVVATTT